MIKTLGGFNAGGAWMKVFVQGVKKKRGISVGFGAKFKKMIMFVVACTLVPVAFFTFKNFLDRLGTEKS